MPTAELEVLKDCFVKQRSPLKVNLFGILSRKARTNRIAILISISLYPTSMQIRWSWLAAPIRQFAAIKKRPVDILVGTQSKFERRKHLPTVEERGLSKGDTAL